MEGVHSSGGFPFEAQCRISRGPTHVLRWAGNRDSYFGGQVGSIAGRYCTQDCFPSFPGRMQGVRLTVHGTVFGSPEGVWLGPNMAHLLTNYCYRQSIVSKSGKFLGEAFQTGIVVTQYDPVSLTIFNIVVDAMVREVLDVVCRPQ